MPNRCGFTSNDGEEWRRMMLYLQSCPSQIYIHSQSQTKIMFSQDLIEHLEDEDAVVDFKAPIVTNYTKGMFSPFSPNPNLTETFPSFLDVSLDQEINRNNATQVKVAILAYMKHCVVDWTDDSKIFEDRNLLSSQVYGQVEDEQSIQGLIGGNPLLIAARKKNILQNFKEFGELRGLFAEIQKIMGRHIARELVFIIAPILESKIQQFQQLINKQTEEFLPRMDRFWGDNEQEMIIPGGWAVYEDLSYEEVRSFAGRKVEEFTSQLYFSKQLKYLSLREVGGEVKGNINVMGKFTTLLVFLCENLFLSMCGMSQSEMDLEEFKQELKLSVGENGQLFEEGKGKKVKTG